MNPAIVVVAYNRPSSLRRILSSISLAKYPSFDINLVISVDKSDSIKILNIAEEFNWKYGQKLVIQHDQHMGLKNHILKCGDLTYKYESIILLEDDLYLSPHFYQYSIESLEHFKNEAKICGVSLFSHCLAESSEMKFIPLEDGGDNYFMQLPSSWGQVWNYEHWSGFKEWYLNERSKNLLSSYLIPQEISIWPDTSWKKEFIKYMIIKDLYFSYPYKSLSVNFVDDGQHHIPDNADLCPPIQLFYKKFNLASFCNSNVIYDAHCELLEECFKKWVPELGKYNFEVDLYGEKKLSQIKKEYILTARETLHPIFKFGLKMRPHESNIILDVKGNDLHFDKVKNIIGHRKDNYIKRISFYFFIPKYFLKIINNISDCNFKSLFNEKIKLMKKKYKVDYREL